MPIQQLLSSGGNSGGLAMVGSTYFRLTNNPDVEPYFNATGGEYDPIVSPVKAGDMLVLAYTAVPTYTLRPLGFSAGISWTLQTTRSSWYWYMAFLSANTANAINSSNPPRLETASVDGDGYVYGFSAIYSGANTLHDYRCSSSGSSATITAPANGLALGYAQRNALGPDFVVTAPAPAPNNATGYTTISQGSDQYSGTTYVGPGGDAPVTISTGIRFSYRENPPSSQSVSFSGASGMAVFTVAA